MLACRDDGEKKRPDTMQEDEKGAVEEERRKDGERSEKGGYSEVRFELQACMRV